MISIQDHNHVHSYLRAVQDEVSTKPNIGASVDAQKALKMPGWDSISISAWKERENIDESKHIKLLRLSHMRYMHPDLSEISQFLLDFGMHVVQKTETKIWWRGYGPEAYVYVCEKGPEKKYLGGAWAVEEYADLER
jgi:hypothetical protein